jgi:hypothetical protein
MLEDSIFINYLMNKMARRNLNRERNRWFMIGADHSYGGRTLNHLDLLTKLKTHCLSLMNMKMHCMLTSVI